MKITYTTIKAVAEWKWDLPREADDTCGICRVEFEGTCSKCKYPGDDCPIIIGACTHCFHMHCITDWIQSEASQGKCPMCRQVFKEKVAEARTPRPQPQTTGQQLDLSTPAANTRSHGPAQTPVLATPLRPIGSYYRILSLTTDRAGVSISADLASHDLLHHCATNVPILGSSIHAPSAFPGTNNPTVLSSNHPAIDALASFAANVPAREPAICPNTTFVSDWLNHSAGYGFAPTDARTIPEPTDILFRRARREELKDILDRRLVAAGYEQYAQGYRPAHWQRQRAFCEKAAGIVLSWVAENPATRADMRDLVEREIARRRAVENLEAEELETLDLEQVFRSARI